MTDIDELVEWLRTYYPSSDAADALERQRNDLEQAQQQNLELKRDLQEAVELLRRTKDDDAQKRTEDRAMKLDAALAQVSEKDAEIEGLRRDMIDKLIAGKVEIAKLTREKYTAECYVKQALGEISEANAEIARLREGIQQILVYCDFPDGYSTLFSERTCKMARALLKETP